MNELITTNEMKKYQEQAKAVYAQTKQIDMSAIILGWKIETGRVLYDPRLNATMEITGQPQNLLYEITTNCESKGIVNHKGQMNAQQIGTLILRGMVEVYYSK